MTSPKTQQVCEKECTSGCHSEECEHHGFSDTDECAQWCTSGCHSDECEHHNR